jgi:hypothetical protein
MSQNLARCGYSSPQSLNLLAFCHPSICPTSAKHRRKSTFSCQNLLRVCCNNQRTYVNPVHLARYLRAEYSRPTSSRVWSHTHIPYRAHRSNSRKQIRNPPTETDQSKNACANTPNNQTYTKYSSPPFRRLLECPGFLLCSLLGCS